MRLAKTRTGIHSNGCTGKVSSIFPLQGCKVFLLDRVGSRVAPLSLSLCLSRGVALALRGSLAVGGVWCPLYGTE